MLVKRYKFSYNNYMNNVELKLNMIAKEMDHLWNGMFIVGGGAVAFLVYEPNNLRLIFGYTGILIFFLFLNAYLTKRIILTELIRKMEASYVDRNNW